MGQSGQLLDRGLEISFNSTKDMPILKLVISAHVSA